MLPVERLSPTWRNHVLALLCLPCNEAAIGRLALLKPGDDDRDAAE
jgi:hypothetical protein